MVGLRIQDSYWGEELLRVVVGSFDAEDAVDDVPGAVEVHAGAGAAHSGDDVLSLAVKQADNGVFVVGEAGGAAPLAEDVHASCDRKDVGSL